MSSSAWRINEYIEFAGLKRLIVQWLYLILIFDNVFLILDDTKV